MEDYGGGRVWWGKTRPINLDKMYNIEDFVLIILVWPS